MSEISNTDDIIDVRDIIARVEELLEERDTLDEAKSYADAVLSETKEIDDGYKAVLEAACEAQCAWESWELSDDRAELAALESLLSHLFGYGGDEQWEGGWYPLTLIRDSYFVTAMQELCEDIGDFPNGIPGYYVIDWKATARNLKVDYSSTEFDGVTYWYR